MKRIDIIQKIGRNYLTSNIENDEFSYAQVLNNCSGHYKLDIRFEIENENRNLPNLSILVETKQNFVDSDKGQLFDYVELEKQYKPENNIIAILANTNNNKCKIWEIPAHCERERERESRSVITKAEEYFKCFQIDTINDKQKVMSATYKLNELLHKNEIPEKVRSQFVGTCLLSLKNGLDYNTSQNTNEILNRIQDILENLLDTSNTDRKKEKIQILYRKVFNEQKIRNITKENFVFILKDIENNILPFINEETQLGQDLLNLFFTTFNKYVGKADKNQAFTPDHIVHFMCKIAKINKNSYVLDPTCGSGAFLVQAMVQAISNCNTEEEKEDIKQNHIFGIENEEKAYGLATTNMLIHGDGNTNIIFRGGTGQKGCFDFTKTNYPKVNTILMNPPYNAVPKGIPDNLKTDWRGANNKKTDPSKGFVFVNHCIKFVNNGGILLCLLPMSCAIGSSAIIQNEKYKILQNNTLKAVFTLPAEMFFPGASVGACCMVFEVGTSHFSYSEETRKNEPREETFFGYFKDDGLVKKKNLGRVDVKNKWEDIEKLWLDLYFGTNESRKNENRSRVKAGLSVLKKVSYEDEWLAEAYMKTDYSTLKQEDFEQTVRDYLSYLVKNNINIED